MVIKHYLCVNIRVRRINLHIARLSNYQDELYDKIKELHDSGLGYRRIAYWLNENRYKLSEDMNLKTIMSILNIITHTHSLIEIILIGKGLMLTIRNAYL